MSSSPDAAVVPVLCVLLIYSITTIGSPVPAAADRADAPWTRNKRAIGNALNFGKEGEPQMQPKGSGFWVVAAICMGVYLVVTTIFYIYTLKRCKVLKPAPPSPKAIMTLPTKTERTPKSKTVSERVAKEKSVSTREEAPTTSATLITVQTGEAEKMQLTTAAPGSVRIQVEPMAPPDEEDYQNIRSMRELLKATKTARAKSIRKSQRTAREGSARKSASSRSGGSSRSSASSSSGSSYSSSTSRTISGSSSSSGSSRSSSSGGSSATYSGSSSSGGGSSISGSSSSGTVSSSSKRTSSRSRSRSSSKHSRHSRRR